MNILLVEPNLPLGNLYQKALEKSGHTVTHATGAQAAVLAADEKAPDVVILELQLMDHSGVEFVYEFRSYPEWQAIPILLHTLVPEPELQTADSFFSAYLYKPTTTLKQLVQKVQELTPVRPA